jgi:xanthine dehydrogenase small subunit
LIRFLLNDTLIETDMPPGTTVLDMIRYHQHLMGTKIGCREGDCGACTILVGELKNNSLTYQSMTSCLLALGNVTGKHIVTIEGINFPGRLNPLQQAMAEEGATQCGFCTPGFILSFAGFCLSDKKATIGNAIAAVDGNICRCTGYKSIERAAVKIAALVKDKSAEPEKFVAERNILPAYFPGIKERLFQIQTQPVELQKSDLNNFLGGGTDLYVQKHDEIKDAALQFLFDHPNLKEISQQEAHCIIGPSATVTDLKNSEIINKAFPFFQDYAKLVSSTPIRNMATIAGNFINASPIGDFTIFFLALDSKLVLRSGDSTRELPLRKLYKGYKQLDKQPSEYIEKISFELPASGSYFNFEKVSKRTNLDIASANSAMLLKMNGEKIAEAGISAGGVGPIPMYLKNASEFLVGKKISEGLIPDLIEIVQQEIAPISDARGTASYKRLLLGQLIKAHFLKLFPELSLEKILSF